MKYYKREGRRFVQINVPQPVNNAGTYYNSNGTFTLEPTDKTIGFCIVSYAHEHVVMSIKTLIHDCVYEYAEEVVDSAFDGKGEIPELQEMLIALILYKSQLQLNSYEDYWCRIDITPYAAIARAHGRVHAITASIDRYVAALRPIIRIPQD